MTTRASPKAAAADPIAEFYELHPYPPPVTDAGRVERTSGGSRFAHHLLWSTRAPDTIESVLVAGCGTSQAARYALAYPDAQIVGIDVTENSIAQTRVLADRLGVSNLDLRRMNLESAEDLGRQFDLVVCTGVIHHLASPPTGLRSLRNALAPGGALRLMVYARYGRTGIYMLQDYCRRLGVTASAPDIADLLATLREIPDAHPIGRLLRESPDFAADDALADALLNPRDRAYSVPELLALLDDVGLRFGRWERQAPYLAACGSVTETPHARRLGQLPLVEQFAALELFRGTMLRHTLIAYGDDQTAIIDPHHGDIRSWIPVVAPTARVIEDRVPTGAAAALLNTAHTETDLVLFVDRRALRLFRSIDGVRTVGQLGRDAVDLVRQLWNHDLVVFDTTAAVGLTNVSRSTM